MNERRTSSRFPLLAAVAATAIVCAGMIAAVLVSRTSINKSSALDGNPLAVDQIVFYETTSTFSQGQLQRSRLSPTTQPIVVLDDDREKSFPREGTWTSPEIVAEFPVSEVVPSWNVKTPPDTGVYFHVRVRLEGASAWSPWLYIGQWGRTRVGSDEEKRTRFPGGTVEVDNLQLDTPARAIQLRATLQSFDPEDKAHPSIRRVAISYSGLAADDTTRERLSPPTKLAGTWARDLAIPFAAQGAAPKPLVSQICSPTSTTMVMRYAGVDRPVLENALAIYDQENDIFGNWGRAVARAGELGLDAYLTRFRNWDQVKLQIERGQPVIASIRVNKGDMPSNPIYQHTAGHLIVVRGFKENGDVIVNDPASKDKGNGVVYKADELAKAWFINAGGVGYIIRSPSTPTSPSTSPTTLPAPR